MTSRRKKLITTILAFTMLICLLPVNSFAVTDNHIAADGTYTAKLQGYKKGKAESGYTATLNVTVTDGKIASIFMTDVKKDKMTKAFNASKYQYFLNNDACITVVDEIASTDAVSSATTSATPTSSKYSLNLVDAIKTALGSAPDSGNISSGGSGSSESDEVLTAPIVGFKSGTMKYTATLNVGITDNKIQNMWLTNASSSKMSSSLQALYTSYLGKEATLSGIENVDAVSSASVKPQVSSSGYSVNLKEALQTALCRGTDYTAAANGQKYSASSGGVSSRYTGTLNARIKNGRIMGLWLTNTSSSTFNSSIFYKTGYNAFLGIAATENSINTAALTSTVTDAAAKASLVDSASASVYSMNLTEALLNIAAQYSAAENTPDETYEGTGTAGDGKYLIKMIIGVKDGNIISIELDDGTTGNWNTVLSGAENLLIGKSTSDACETSVDAVSSATQYSAAFYRTAASALGYEFDDTLEILSVLQSDGLFNVTLSKAADEGVIIIASYLGDGRLDKVHFENCDGKSEYSLPLAVDESTSKACLFIWNDLSDLRPLCKCKPVDIVRQ